MFAVVKISGKQYKLELNEIFKVNKIEGEVGQEIVVDKVLALSSKEGDLSIGSPYVDGAKVKVSILEQKRDKKIIVFKKKRRKNYRKKQGHRDYITVLKVTDIASK